MSQSYQLADKVAVVTGASSGIGAATARRLAERGMTVVAAARRVDRLDRLASEQARIHARQVDVTDTESVDALAADVREQFGACHVLVNNAGIGGGPFRSRADLDDAMGTIDVNVFGVMRCTAAFADLLEAGAPSRVINVGSVAGKLGLGPAAYAASKFAVVGFSEALSFSWAERGITVCQLNPGFIATEGFPQEQVKRTPIRGLVGKPTDVAAAIEEAIVTGTTERTVPRFYRPFVVLRHTATPLYRAIARKLPRATGTRD
ncbi:SDR family NAD(P)-dependent oxidoreductase [Euzebya tangerina]|uniref:SDR family NAD(P)-dependent oxidoreductase n=1 Tax=Euzebya tangerina TaxID=591198 RepID=UPI000E30B63B|nr:SDR family oxidoreductase [Euzebya tangerina]